MPGGPDLCARSTPAWTARLIFEPRWLTVLARASLALRHLGGG